MENRDNSSENDNGVNKDATTSDNDMKASRSNTIVARSRGDDFAEEFPPELPVRPSAPFAVAPSASSNLKHDLAPDTRKVVLEHALPVEPYSPTRRHVPEPSERDAAIVTNNHDVAPGAVAVAPSRLGRTTPPPLSSYDSSIQFANDESRQEGGIPNNRQLVESDFYEVEAQRVPEGTDLVAEAEHVTVKWYQRPLYWLFLAGGLLFVGALLGAVMVLVVRPGEAKNPAASAPTTAPLTMSPSPEPTSLAPELIACSFLSISSLDACRATTSFENANSTSGSTIPSEIGILTQLTHLDLNENQLTGPIPSSLASLTQLQVLSFYSNELSGTIPLSLSSLTQLQWLSFNGNQLTGNIPSSLSGLVQLTYLSLSENALNGTIPSSLSSLTMLTALTFRGNQLTGKIPSSLSSLTLLTGLYLFLNQLTGTIPSSLSSLTMLTALYLDNNQLSGSIPPSLSSLTELAHLTFSDNALNGTIPSSLSSLTMLTALYFAENQLSGSIPPSLSSLTELTELSFRGNQLTGKIPSSLSSLTLLTGLYLFLNQLTGTIPSSLSSLVQLNGLYLYGNQLTGTIPSLFASLTLLTDLLFNSNDLSGSIPSSLCSHVTNLLIDCGEIECSCCESGVDPYPACP